MKRVAVLGSSGSVGRTALKVIKQYNKEFKLEVLSVNNNTAGLAAQIAEYKPAKAVIVDALAGRDFVLSKGLSRTKILRGIEGLEAAASDKDVDIVVIAISGSIALYPLLAAIRAGKEIALANKEALVMAGNIIMRSLKGSPARLIPVDSEQSAIFQCLEGREKAQVRKLYLTASGGELYDVPLKDFRSLSPARVLQHPRWKMGKKITVDSSTLMNKGLEVIEARWLFDTDVSKIKVVIHRQAIIHSMVEFVDGVVLAQLGATDMSLPIQYALSYPGRLENKDYCLDFERLEPLTFSKADTRKFPCLDFAYQAAQAGGTLPAVMNAANEEAVRGFLEGRIGFVRIPKIIEKIMSIHKSAGDPELDEILEADTWAREEARKLVKK